MESLNRIFAMLRDGSWRKTWEEFCWIWSYGKKYWKEILFYCFLGIFGTIFSLISSIASKNVIDIVTGIQRDKMGTMVAIMIPMALFSLLFSSICSRISLKINIRIQNDIQGDIFDQIVNVRWLDLSEYSPGDLLNRFGSDASAVAGSAIGWLPNLVNSLFSFLCTLVVVIYYDPAMGLITALNAPIMLIASRFTLKRMRSHTEKLKKMGSEYLQYQQETFNNIDTIKSFGMMDHFSGKLRFWQNAYKEVTLDHNRFSLVTNSILSILGMVIQYAAYFWCIYRLWSGSITYGEMTLFLSQGNKLAGHFKSVVSIIPTTLSATISARRIMDIVQLPKENTLPEGNTVHDPKESYTVSMENVCFSYREGAPVFSNAGFHADPGEIIGLVGPSGAGKTTCIRLLLGLITPERGAVILTDSTGRKEPAGAATRELYSYVPQANTIFSGTIAENLRLVCPDADENALRRALEIACAMDFVDQLPEGIHTKLGQMGSGLSEGQAQRLAIARAVLRDAPILLLDEATSALDPQTEKRVLHNLLENVPQKTCIVTTHRASTLSQCQRVYSIQNGTLRTLSQEEIAAFGR